MADLKRIKARIKALAQGSRTNVTIEEIEWVVFHLKQNGYKTKVRPAGDHQKPFTVEEQMFGVCTHRRGSTHLKRFYVDAFINAMIELGLYEED
jgi:hypothetical protein